MIHAEVTKYHTFATPGFIREYGGTIPAAAVIAAVAPLLGAAGQEPSWIIGDPHTERPYTEDSGHTLRIPAPGARLGRRFYAVRDDHEAGCGCGCGGGAVITFILPEEY